MKGDGTNKNGIYKNLHDELDEGRFEKCKCGRELEFVETPNCVHYGKLMCPMHGFMKWVRNPKKKEKRGASKFDIRSVLMFHKMPIGKPFCFFCLRNEEQLGAKETLTTDHIIQITDGGSDTIENLQILCTACHRLKNWSITYVNKHFVDDDD